MANKFDCENIVYVGNEILNERSIIKKIKISSLPKNKIIEQLTYKLYHQSQNSYENSTQLDDNTITKSLILGIDIFKQKNTESIITLLSKFLDFSPLCLINFDTNSFNSYIEKKSYSKTPKQVESKIIQFFITNGYNLGPHGFIKNNLTNKSFNFIGLLENNKKTISKTSFQPPPKFKVLAIMTAYNEEDIISQSIHKLLQQGIDVHVIENWSTDNTFPILKNLEKQGLISLERFPPDGPSKHYDWDALLKRVEQVSKEIKADWYVHHDVDEIRNSPWPDYNLKQGIFRVDQEGYNSIDHTVIFFQPIDDEFIAGTDFESYFKHFEFGKRSGHFLQIKAWKNCGQDLSLADSGGHEVKFDGRKVYPYKFLLKHYQFRTTKQARRKVFVDRKPRWNPMEKKGGWHTHYDHIDEGFNFLKSPSELELFKVEKFNKKYLVERLSSIGILDLK